MTEANLITQQVQLSFREKDRAPVIYDCVLIQMGTEPVTYHEVLTTDVFSCTADDTNFELVSVSFSTTVTGISAEN